MFRNYSYSKWPEIRELIKLNWDQIDDEEIDSLKGRLDNLSDILQRVYHFSKDQADRELIEFRQLLNPKKNNSFYLPNKNFLF